MTTLLIPDSGPLFSLAAADLLGVLLHFRVAITDIVKEESIDKGKESAASIEAQRLLEFYSANKARVELFATQVGHDLRSLRKKDPGYRMPRNVGELSIQSLLIHLQVQGIEAPPIVLFEDAWFLRNAEVLAKPCLVLSTQAFLVNAEALGLIESAAEARRAIAALRPTAYAKSFRR